MFELPEHLASLNTLAPAPATPQVDQSVEDAVWEYLHTDALFQNFGVNPSEYDSKSKSKEQDQVQQPQLDITVPPPTPATLPTPASNASGNANSYPADLKSFIEQFASDSNNYASGSNLNANANANANAPAGGSNDFANALAIGLNMTNPNHGISMSDIFGGNNVASSSSGVSPSDEPRPSGAKKLKQMGAGQAEIEEDKRRRNTEASARFRAKKKEREQALEIRAKELENQVAALTNDKHSLENENRLLKAIVLGSRGGGEGAQEALEQFLGKRKRIE